LSKIKDKRPKIKETRLLIETSPPLCFSREGAGGVST